MEKRIGDALRPLARRRGLPRDVAMNPSHRIGGRERKLPGQHLVKRHAQRIEIAATVDRPVHAAGLLG